MNTTKLLILLLSSCIISLEALSIGDPYSLISHRSNQFGRNLYDVVINEIADKNAVISTLSVFLVLLMLERGACGTTKKALQKTLLNVEHFEFDDYIMDKCIKELHAKLTNIQIANNIYVNNRFNIKSSYQQSINEEFQASPSYFYALNPNVAAQEINKFVEDKTNYKIQNIIDENEITHETVIILVNAIYFKASWETPFPEFLTKDREFNTKKNCTIKVQTMKHIGEFSNGLIPLLNAKFIRIPYETPGIEMVIILPNDIDGLIDMELQLKYYKIDELMSDSSVNEVLLELPKFKFDRSFQLNQLLDKIGLADLFRKPDLSALAKGPLIVSQVKHKAFIAVDEKGTEASGATFLKGNFLSAKPPPKPFIVNHPFHFNIRIFGTTVFQGHVIDPSK